MTIVVAKFVFGNCSNFLFIKKTADKIKTHQILTSLLATARLYRVQRRLLLVSAAPGIRYRRK